MKRVLEKEIEFVLQSRVYISRSTKIFSLAELSRHYTMSITTLRRYSSEHYRQLSRDNARKAYMEQKESHSSNHGRCYKCQKPHRSHSRCTDCEILTHGIVTCGSCIDNRRIRRIRSLTHYNFHEKL